MFDIAFSEVVVIMVVALVVIGPERLPKVARTMGHLWGRMQRYVQTVKSDIASDIAIEEAKRLGESIRKDLAPVEQSVVDARMELEQKILQAQLGKSADATEGGTTAESAAGATPKNPELSSASAKTPDDKR